MAAGCVIRDGFAVDSIPYGLVLSIHRADSSTVVDWFVSYISKKRHGKRVSRRIGFIPYSCNPY